MTSYIHLGIPKTATTCLQNYLFEQHSQVYYFGKFSNGTFPPSVRPALTGNFRETQSIKPGDIREACISKQLEYAAEHGLTPVLSREGLAGTPLWRKYAQARLFKKCFGDCRVILVVREPSSFIQSQYTEMLKAFHGRDPDKRRGWMKRLKGSVCYFDINEWLHTAWRSKNSPRHFISYADTARIYARALGHENVKIFIFEEFIRNPERFITGLCNYIGIDPQEGFNLIDGKRANERITTEYIRRLQEIDQSESLSSRFCHASPRERKKMLNPKDQTGDKFKPELSTKWLKKINAVGDKQNRQLIREWGLPLADYGYRT